MLQVNKITIEYEGGAKVVIDKSAHGIMRMAVSRGVSNEH
jgi:hypothetical protein